MKIFNVEWDRTVRVVCDASSKLSHLGLEKRRTDFEVDGGNLFQEKLQDTQSSQATSIS